MSHTQTYKVQSKGAFEESRHEALKANLYGFMADTGLPLKEAIPEYTKMYSTPFQTHRNSNPDVTWGSRWKK